MLIPQYLLRPVAAFLQMALKRTAANRSRCYMPLEFKNIDDGLDTAGWAFSAKLYGQVDNLIEIVLRRRRCFLRHR